jgi:hypothetical protein
MANGYFSYSIPGKLTELLTVLFEVPVPAPKHEVLVLQASFNIISWPDDSVACLVVPPFVADRLGRVVDGSLELVGENPGGTDTPINLNPFLPFILTRDTGAVSFTLTRTGATSSVSYEFVWF